MTSLLTKAPVRGDQTVIHCNMIVGLNNVSDVSRGVHSLAVPKTKRNKVRKQEQTQANEGVPGIASNDF